MPSSLQKLLLILRLISCVIPLHALPVFNSRFLNSWLPACSRQKIAHPAKVSKMSTHYCPEPVNMLSNIVKGAFQIQASQGSWAGEIIQDYLYGPKITTRILFREKLEYLLKERDVTTETKIGMICFGDGEKGQAWAKECRWPLEDGKGKGKEFLLQFPEGKQSVLCFDFSLMILISNFRLSELYDK